MAKTVILIGHLGAENILKASIECWQKNFPKADIIVVGEPCNLPKGIAGINCKVTPGGNTTKQLIAAAAETIKEETFIFALNSYPISKITVSDIDKPYWDGESFATGLPQLLNKQKAIDVKVPENTSFEDAYFSVRKDNKSNIVLHDLSDKIRLCVLNLSPDVYRTKHLLKHKKFLVVNANGQKFLDKLMQ